jgi:hypothetical protein
VTGGEISPGVSQQFAFEEAAEAIELMRTATAFGRVALIPPPL